MPFFKIQDRAIHFQELNRTNDAAQTIVLVHGMFSNLSVYYFKIAPILAKHFHVVMYDLKSHGLSDRASEGYDLDHMVDDLLVLLAYLNVERVHLVGYSFGGLVALHMAMKYPAYVERLCVIEAPDPGDRKTMDIIDIYSKEFLEHYIQNFTDTTKIKMGKRQLEKNHRMYQYLFHETDIKSDMEKEVDYFTRAPFKQLAMDTLLLYGRDSNCLAAGTFLNEQIQPSSLHVLEGDHNLPIQQPEQVAVLVDAFLKHTYTAI